MTRGRLENDLVKAGAVQLILDVVVGIRTARHPALHLASGRPLEGQKGPDEDLVAMWVIGRVAVERQVLRIGDQHEEACGPRRGSLPDDIEQGGSGVGPV